MVGRVVLLMLACWLGVAAADRSPTTLSGRVTDVLGQPIAGARIYVLSRSGSREETRTNKQGRYSVGLSTRGAHGVVVAIDKAHTYRTVLIEPARATTLDIEVELDMAGGEVIRIVDKQPPVPAVKPKPRQDPRKSLPYSDEAVERDAWAKAWLLLDVDRSGVVQRLKLLKAPGFGLDRIAIEEGFKLRFDPALATPPARRWRRTWCGRWSGRRGAGSSRVTGRRCGGRPTPTTCTRTDTSSAPA
ncbi:MAG: carboxypeptidase-like regulatory domain-containing protein [Myxococcota bacterium]|nr:carboxypeptidase-like regulatory domain-containing protein [Myxococcota bacterium]